MANPYVYIWAYEVLPGRVDDFVALYGPNGSWVALFRRGSGYIDTQLLRDRTDSQRFVTIDRWESKKAFTGLRDDHGDEFDRLDHLGEELTSSEILMGEFVVTG